MSLASQVIALAVRSGQEIKSVRALAAAKYTRPGTGIPASDLAADVQSKLNLAQSALQSVPVATATEYGLVRVDGASAWSEPDSFYNSYALVNFMPDGSGRLGVPFVWNLLAQFIYWSGGGWIGADPDGAAEIVRDVLDQSTRDTLAKADAAPTPADMALKADLVGGVVPTSQIPAIATTQSVMAANAAARLALTSAQVQPGDYVTEQDTGACYVLINTPISTASNWKRVDASGGGITSVNGQAGPTVVLGKGDIGLGNVDNTSDANKPVSTATQTALNGKSNTGHTHTKAEVGLGNVDNTSDASKPVSSATQSALDGKLAKLGTINGVWGGSQNDFNAMPVKDNNTLYIIF